MSRRKPPIPSSRQSPLPAAVQSGQIRTVTQTVAYSGPLPSADEMEKYRRISPDWPERIIAMAEKEQEARLAEQKKRSDREDIIVRISESEARRADELVKVNQSTVKRGQLFGFLSIFTIMTAAVLCAKFGHPVTAGFIGSGGVVMIAVVFVAGSKIKIPLPPPK